MLARAGARSGRVAESDGATGQAVTGPRDFGPLGRCTHIGVGARRDRFSTIAKRGRRCLREPAHGLGEWPRAMARRGRRLPDLGISAPSVVARILARARGATDFRPSRSGGATVPVAAHSLRACRRAMAHRRRRFADLAIPLTPMLTHILTWVIDATDFRPSRSGGATVPVAAHSLQACRRAMAHRRRRFADLDRGISAPSVVARIFARGRATRPIFDHP